MHLYQDRPLTVEKRVGDLLPRLSLAEKIGQLNQLIFGWKCYRRVGTEIELTPEFRDAVRDGAQGGIYGLLRADPWSGATFGVGLTAADGARVANQMQRYAMEQSRWGIPLLLNEECPHGHMALEGTIFPANVGAACSWNPELYRRSMEVAAREIRARGGNLGLISVLDLARDPRWGRTEETLGEDPHLTARFAEAAVLGLQGGDADYLGAESIGAVVKHAAAQGEASGGRNTAPALIGERELREIHFPPIRAAFRAGATAAMAAYNEIDGLPCIGSRWLLTSVFRGEMGFDGAVMADATSIDRLSELLGLSLVEAAARALRAGVDLSLWDKAYLLLPEVLEKGLASMEDLDAAAARVLALKFRLGLFDQPYRDETIAVETRSAAHRQINFDLACESLVLLKNQDGLLPLSPQLKRIAVLGPNADAAYNQLGDYTPPQRADQVVTLLAGLRAQAPPGLEILHRAGCGVRSLDASGMDEAVEAARESEVAILCLGGASTREFGAVFDATGAIVPGKFEAEMDCGEGADVSSLRLPGCQNELFRRVMETGTPTVVVLVQGRPYAIPEIAAQARAILAAWYPGQEGGRAVASVLLGETTPSGKLCLSVPHSEGQLPVYYNYKPRARGDYLDLQTKPLFPFGYGLSYTRFAYGDLDVRVKSATSATVAVTVKNTGNRAGAEVAQLYLRDVKSSVTRRMAELKAFEKVLLQPGETRRLEFALDAEAFGLWNEAMQWQIEPGDFEVRVGGDSLAALGGTITLPGQSSGN